MRTPPKYLLCVVLTLLSLVAMTRESAAQPEEDVCAYVARMTNQGRLLEIRLAGRAPSGEEDYGHSVFYDKLDINGDGVIEHVYVVLEGTALVASLYFRDANLREIPYELGSTASDELRWADAILVTRYGGAYYFVGVTDDRLFYVALLSTDFDLIVLCEFDQAPAPATRIVSSSDDAVCEGALRGELAYVPFDKPHEVTVEALGMWETGPSRFAAETDIDNDGDPDAVVGIVTTSGRGAGCDAYGLAILNDTRTGLADTPAASLLLRTGSTCDSVQLRPFRFGNAVYLERKYEERHIKNEHQVFKIADEQRQLICEIEARMVNIVVR